MTRTELMTRMSEVITEMKCEEEHSIAIREQLQILLAELAEME